MTMQVHELGANVEKKILYAKNPVEILKIKLWSAVAILNIAAMLAAILKQKSTKTISGKRGYCVPKTGQNPLPSRRRSWTRGHRLTDGRMGPPKELALAKAV